MLPNFLIIGSARCGTTYLSKVLQSHPEIFMPPKKELHFFDRHYKKGIDYYKKLFINAEGISKYKAIGEATPAYLYFESIAPRIATHLPNIKLIVILRNPVDAAYSMHWKAYAKEKETRHLTFEEKLDVKERMCEGGKYIVQIKRYIEYFKSEDILVLIYEDFMSDKTRGFKEIYNFLNVDSNFVSPYMEHRINSASNKIGKSVLLNSLYKIFFRYIKVPAITKYIQKKNSFPIPPMNQETRLKLISYFEPYNAELESFLNKDLSKWRS